MAFKLVVLACVLAAANAGLIGAPAAVAYSAAPAVSHVSYASPVVSYGAPHGVAVATPALTSQSSNILRSYGNLGQIAHQSKTITTPFSSVSKSDVRVSNPGLRVAAAPAYAAYAAPAIHAAPVAYAAHAAPVAYASHAAPVAYASHAGYAAPAVAYSSPAVAAVRTGATTVTGHGLLGVAYSPSVAVSHMTYAAPAIQYGW